MLGNEFLSIEEGSVVTRCVWVRGSTGQVEIVRTWVFEGQDRSLTRVVTELKSAKAPIRRIVLGVPNEAASVRYNLVPPVPDWRLALIMKYETDEMAEKSGEVLSSDWRQLDLVESEADDLVLLVAQGRESHLAPKLEEIQNAGGRVLLALPNCLGSYHAYRQGYSRPPEETVVLIDLGGNESHVSLASNGQLYFARSVTFGGGQIDEIIASALQIDEEAARKLKERLSSGKAPPELVQSAQPALRKAFGQVASMIRGSVNFCKTQTKIPGLEADRVVLMGATSQIPGLLDYLRDELDTRVEYFEPQLVGEVPPVMNTRAGIAWGISLGIALSGFDDDEATLDLLTAEAKQKREFHERTVFNYAAIGVLGLSLLLYFGAVLMARSRSNGLKEDLVDIRRSVQGWESEKEAARKSNRQVRSQIAALTDEVSNSAFMARFLEFLSSELPASMVLDHVEAERDFDGEARIVLEIEGRSSDAEKKGLDNVLLLEEKLSSLAGVAWVRSENSGLSAGYYGFRMELSPQPEPSTSEETRREGPRRRRGR